MPTATVTTFPNTQHHFLRIKDVCTITALSQSFIYALQAKGQFPKSRKIASKVSIWLESDVQEWMQHQWELAA
jgi:predicted DNA-binding transcriptional regulator AlpA